MTDFDSHQTSRSENAATLYLKSDLSTCTARGNMKFLLAIKHGTTQITAVVVNERERQLARWKKALEAVKLYHS